MARKRWHITILVANLPAERDRRVIRQCLALEQAGYEVTVIAPRGDRTLRTLPGSRGTRLRPYPVVVQGSGVLSYAVEFGWSFACVAVRLIGEVLRGRAHGVQACNPPDVYWPLALLLRGIGRPWVFDHHDLSPEVYATRSGGHPNRWASRALTLLEWLTLRTATAVIVTNQSFRENALRRGVPDRKVSVVRNGPSAAEIGGPGRDPSGGHRIVYLGVLGPQDNVEVTVRAAGELAPLRGRLGWRLVIAGDGECRPALAKLATNLGMADLVEFTGWLDGPGVDALLRRATVAVQPDAPTRMNQLSTMAKTVEYLARGVPVVAADLLETRRTAGSAAVYLPAITPDRLAGALDELLDDPDRRERMRVAGLARFAQLLSWERQAAGYLDVWHTVLGAPHGPRHADPYRRRARRRRPRHGRVRTTASRRG
jgi:glycosyltransferase involved in cell wall biosynthesis